VFGAACRRPCQHREEENYFFALSKYQAQLEALLEAGGDDGFVQPASRRNEVLGWVREGETQQGCIVCFMITGFGVCTAVSSEDGVLQPASRRKEVLGWVQ
jgi:hypothetical protein